jgi:hypothetical protein
MGNVIFIDADGKRHEFVSSHTAKQAKRPQSSIGGYGIGMSCAKLQLGDGWLRVSVNLTEASDKSVMTAHSGEDDHAFRCMATT